MDVPSERVLGPEILQKTARLVAQKQPEKCPGYLFGPRRNLGTKRSDGASVPSDPPAFPLLPRALLVLSPAPILTTLMPLFSFAKEVHELNF